MMTVIQTDHWSISAGLLYSCKSCVLIKCRNNGYHRNNDTFLSL